MVGLKYIGFVFVILALFSCDMGKGEKLSSPDDNIIVHVFKNENNEFGYSVSFKKDKLLDWSRLGLKTVFEGLGSDFKIISSTSVSSDDTWKTVWGQRSIIRNNYNELLLKLQNSTNQNLNIRFRVFNDGVAFRYEIPGNDSIVIYDELTEFNFTQDLSAWWTPQDFDSYEHLYQNSKISELKAVNTPITFEGNGVYVTIHEAQLENYAGMTLEKTDSLKLKAELVPWKDGVKVKSVLPLNTPWRTIQIGDELSDLTGSSMILNLNKPNVIADVSWINPMSYIGVWWEMHMGISTWDLSGTHGARTENVKRYIDFASEHNIGGVLVEGWNVGWETWHTDKSIFDFVEPYADFNMDEIAQYAKAKNVELIGHHETGGSIAVYEQQLDEAFQYYQANGVKVIKTGYAGSILPEGEHHHGQFMVEHYRKVVEKAVQYQIMIDAHEPIKATGLSRTYPNMMTREGARGMEWNAWSRGNSPEYTTILPYTRLLAGPIDYTPGIFNLKFNGYDEGTRVHSTLARQLALMVVLYSPLQMAADMPSNYENNRAFQFIRDLKTDFDESFLLAGEIGDYTVIGRKTKGVEEWFVGAITDEEERIVEFSLNFLKKGTMYKAEVYADAENTNWDTNPTAILIDSFLVSSDKNIKIAMSPAGGTAIRIIPVHAKQLKSINQFNELADGFSEKFKSIYKYGDVRRITNVAIHSVDISKSEHSDKYPANGLKTIVDGELGDVLDKNVRWQAYRENDLVIELEFDQEIEIDTIQLSCLVEHISWMFAPESVTIIYDGGEKMIEIKKQTKELIGSKREYVTLYFDKPIITKKVKIIAKPLSNIPEWHSAKGEKAWLFVDELIVK